MFVKGLLAAFSQKNRTDQRYDHVDLLTFRNPLAPWEKNARKNGPP